MTKARQLLCSALFCIFEILTRGNSPQSTNASPPPLMPSPNVTSTSLHQIPRAKGLKVLSPLLSLHTEQKHQMVFRIFPPPFPTSSLALPSSYSSSFSNISCCPNHLPTTIPSLFSLPSPLCPVLFSFLLLVFISYQILFSGVRRWQNRLAKAIVSCCSTSSCWQAGVEGHNDVAA